MLEIIPIVSMPNNIKETLGYRIHIGEEGKEPKSYYYSLLYKRVKLGTKLRNFKTLEDAIKGIIGYENKNVKIKT